MNPKHQTKLTKVFVPRKFATIMNEKKNIDLVPDLQGYQGYQIKRYNLNYNFNKFRDHVDTSEIFLIKRLIINIITF